MSSVSTIAGIIVLFPTFANANFDGMGTATGGGVPTVGYYEYTYNKLRNGSDLFWVVLFYALAFYAFIPRLLWREWKSFINLRFEFLSARYSHFFLNCLPSDPKRPTEPLAPIDNEGRLRLLHDGNKFVVKALPYYLQQIRELNKKCNDEAGRLFEANV